MVNLSYFLLILFVIFLVPILFSQLFQKTPKVSQEGGAFNASLMYQPIMPTGKGCNKSPDAPGLAYSSLYTSDLARSLDSPGRAQDQHYSSRKTPMSFNPPCLTKKPYGNSMALYNYWKYLPNLLESQYLSCDKYKCATKVENGYEALPRLEKCIKTNAGKVELSPTLACDVVNQQYYNSPEDFCRAHPEHYPCPNWWMNDPVQIRDVSRYPYETHTQKFTPQVSNTKNNLGFCLSGDPSCGLNDGPGVLMVQRHREDHGLC